MDELVVVKDLKKWFPVRSGLFSRTRRRYVRAIDGVSFSIRKGEMFCLAGESGCGKTTTGRTILRLEMPTSGEVFFDNKNVYILDKKELKEFRRQAQMIFQDPLGSLDPRANIFSIISEGLSIHNIGSTQSERIDMVSKSLEEVGLSPGEFLYRYPHELSGGQQQRVAIASAMILRPRFIVSDEPVSMLDMSTRGSIIKILMELKESMKLTFLLITHDLALVKYISDRIAIMYLGNIVEEGPAVELIDNPYHPYTTALISAVPSPDPNKGMGKILIEGEVSSFMDVSQGCRFAPRCLQADEKCRQQDPELVEITKDHFVKCWGAQK